MKGSFILVPMDRLGVVGVQGSIVSTVKVINELLKENKEVRWIMEPTKLTTLDFPEGHIYNPGIFLLEEQPVILSKLTEQGIHYTVTELDSEIGTPLKTTKTALYVGRGAAEFCTSPLMEVLNLSGFQYQCVTDQDIRNGVLPNFDILLIPGGPDAGESFYHGLGELGYQNIKDFVASKGQYFGICAGAYLALTSQNNENHYWLNLVDATDEQELDYWRTGTGFTRLEVEDRKHPFAFGMVSGTKNTFDIVYWEGPAFQILSDQVKVLATYQSFVASGTQEDYPKWDLLDNGPAIDSINNWYNVLTKDRFEQHLKDQPAIIEQKINGNKVLLYSPHAEFGSIGITKRKDSQVFQFISNALFYLGTE